VGNRRATTIAAVLGAAVLAGCAGSVPDATGPATLRDDLPVAAAEATLETAPAQAMLQPPEPSNRAVEPAAAPAHLPAGMHERQIDVDGHIRRWTTVVPAAVNGSRPPALVVVLHAVGGQGADMRSKGFEPLAAEQGVVMAYPDALGGAWNDGRPGADAMVPGVTVDDSRFLRLLIEETVARTGADTRRVAVVGASNGAMMAARVACDLADRVSAVALVVGSAGQGFEQSCRPARPVAVMIVAGSDDATVPYAGGRVADSGTRRRGYVAGVEEFFDYWRAQNGCTSTQILAGSAAVSGARGSECRSGNAVLRYRVDGGGHEWYRMPRFDTTTAIWAFVNQRFATAA